MVSETLREVGCELDGGGIYGEITLVGETSRCRVYSAVRAGKRFLLKAAASDGIKDVEALKREYETLAPLSHPGLAYVFTYEACSPVGPCIVMEYVDGRSLEEYLKEGPSLRNRHRVFSQLLDVVGYIHKKGILHNDLSPQNIIITSSDDSVKLIDFGFADDDTHYLGKGRGGTLGYASPELLEGSATDSRSDIYSLGMLMKDIFGNRHTCVSHRASNQNAKRRYPSAQSLRKAWAASRRIPIYITLLVFLIVSSALVVDYCAARRELSAVQTEQRERADKLGSIKDNIDQWYLSNITAEKERMEISASYDEAFAIWTALIEDYNEFWNSFMKDCPEDISADVISYMALKYNAEFPLPPARSK